MTPVEEVAKRAYEQYVARCLVLSDEPGASSPTPVSFKHFKIAWVHTVESEIKARLNGDDERWSADTHDQPIPATKLVYPWDEEKAFLQETRAHSFLSSGKRSKPTLARYDAVRDSGGNYRGKFGVWPNSDFGDD